MIISYLDHYSPIMNNHLVDTIFLGAIIGGMIGTSMGASKLGQNLYGMIYITRTRAHNELDSIVLPAIHWTLLGVCIGIKVSLSVNPPS